MSLAGRKAWHAGKPTSRPLAERIWEKVDKSAGESGCWIWLGSADYFGRAQIWWNGRLQRVSRAVIFLTTGKELPKELLACHTCDNPLCVNPKHLFAGTASDNMRDMVAKGRRVPGIRKPPFTPDEEAAVVRRYVNGGSIHGLSNELDVSERRIRSLLDRAGVRRRTR